MGLHPVIKMIVTAAVVTGVIFLEIFACVPDNWVMLVTLVPLILTPVPLLLLRCCGDSDGILSSSPKGRHWAEFWSAFLFMSTIALPVLLYTTGSLTSVMPLILSLSGVLLAVCFTCTCAFLQARAEDDNAFHSW